MSKRWTPEIEKCLREAQANMQTYDMKWRELKSYNEATANPDWATLEGGVIKSPCPEPLQLSYLRPKKAVSYPQYIVVDISNMNERQVTEAKDKLKNELEALMKKVYRSRQLIMEWLTHTDLRQSGFTREHLLDAKKEIEVRHRRGKVYFLRGVSSEDTENEQASKFKDVIQWMQEYIERLRDKSDQFTAEIEAITRKSEQNSRLDRLKEAVQSYLAHASRLDEFLRGIRNNAISVAGVNDDGDRGGGGEEESEEEVGGESVNALLEALAELREVLKPLIEENEDLSYVVTEDIYGDLGIVVGGTTNKTGDTPCEEVVEADDLLGKASVSLAGDPSPAMSMKPTANNGTPTSVFQGVPPANNVNNAWSRTTTVAAESPQVAAAPAKQSLSYKNALQPTSGATAVEARQAVEARLRALENQLSVPDWRDSIELELGAGVTTNVCDLNLLWQLAPSVRDQILQQVEAMLSSQGNSLPVLVVDEDVTVRRALKSWYGEADRGGVWQKDASLLYVDEGSAVEILATAPKERWTYGRLAADRSRQGWFPSTILQTDTQPPPTFPLHVDERYLH